MRIPPFLSGWRLAVVLPVVVMAVLFAFPRIDLTISSWFWDGTGRVFIARNWWPTDILIRRGLPPVVAAVAALILILTLTGELLHRALLGLTRPVAAYLLGSLALGPGLIVNLIFKDHWGRPRPSTLIQFGGDDTYVRPLIPSDQCDTNCSLPSGHASLAFWALSFALLAPPPWRRTAIGLAVGFGILVGVVRIAQGGHFLSDVVFAGMITAWVALTLHHWLNRHRGKNRTDYP